MTLKDLKPILNKVNTPGRYTGGEFGSIIKADAPYRTAVCFPDLYEIGMSNHSIRILYDLINNHTQASCERFFSPDSDFEDALNRADIPLFTLETKIPIHELDLIGFSVGYELCATNILAALSSGNIPLYSSQRKNDDPIIIAGGPGITNPVPFGDFIDAVYIGECEHQLVTIISHLTEMKRKDASRQSQIEYLHSLDFVWYKGKESPTKSTIFSDFSTSGILSSYLVPNIKVVQDHGVVEIMRGCPNGCRFCHAGILYRPFREKDPSQVYSEAADLIQHYGYREITLASLSSGDYHAIGHLIQSLNEDFAPYRASFALPSLKIDSFTLPLLYEISQVRKSGLTFAVETPGSEAQTGLNKIVQLEQTINIIQSAKEHGWRTAKFYFMIGLPVVDHEKEGRAIIDFLLEVQKKTGLNFNVNIGTFVPKPHTPFQWDGQLGEYEALETIKEIRAGLPRKSFKVGYHKPFMSFLEGIIARGDDSVGSLLYDGFSRGARFDAWEDRIRMDEWRSVFSNYPELISGTCKAKIPGDPVPWSAIELGTSQNYLLQEKQYSLKPELRSKCKNHCSHNCGVCRDDNDVTVKNGPIKKRISIQPEEEITVFLIRFHKTEESVFLSHINIMTVFERSIQRAGFFSVMTQGFNPKPKLEFAQPLSLGVESSHEIAKVSLHGMITPELFMESINKALPKGLFVSEAKQISNTVKSLMSVYSGSQYLFHNPDDELKSIFDSIQKQDQYQGIEITVHGTGCNQTVSLGIPMKEKQPSSLPKLLKEYSSFADILSAYTIERTAMYCITEDTIADHSIGQLYFDAYS